MEKVKSGGIMMTWNPEVRLAVISFEHETRATGEDAALLVEAMERWAGTDEGPFALLGDGGKLSGVDAEYRSNWSRFFRRHRKHSWVAFYNMNLFIRVAAEMFRIGTGVRLKAFADEESARQWLREKGIRA